jgi:hypothetical protein
LLLIVKSLLHFGQEEPKIGFLRLKRYGPTLTMAVVGRFPGTGVPAEWNVLIDQMKSAEAKTAISATNGIAKLGTIGRQDTAL